MRLYVWHGVFCDYTCGVAFALADSIEQARELIIASAPEQWQREQAARELTGEPAIYDQPFGCYVMGGG